MAATIVDSPQIIFSFRDGKIYYRQLAPAPCAGQWPPFPIAAAFSSRSWHVMSVLGRACSACGRSPHGKAENLAPLVFLLLVPFGRIVRHGLMGRSVQKGRPETSRQNWIGLQVSSPKVRRPQASGTEKSGPWLPHDCLQPSNRESPCKQILQRQPRQPDSKMEKDTKG